MVRVGCSNSSSSIKRITNLVTVFTNTTMAATTITNINITTISKAQPCQHNHPPVKCVPLLPHSHHHHHTHHQAQHQHHCHLSSVLLFSCIGTGERRSVSSWRGTLTFQFAFDHYCHKKKLVGERRFENEMSIFRRSNGLKIFDIWDDLPSLLGPIIGFLNKYTNTQIHNTQIYKYTNIQIYKYTNTQIHKYTNT